MICNADITIFNKRYDAEQRTEIFFPTKIRGVSFYKRGDVSEQKKETVTNDVYTIRIPINADTGMKLYLEESEYEALPEENFHEYWTLQPGAIVIKGLSDLETATEVELNRMYPDAVRIMNFTDNTSRGSKRVQHWRIGGE